MRPAPTHLHTAVATFAVIGSCVLLFAQLGHYALWDDEAQTAIFAQNVWRTGDTNAMVGMNIQAAHDGGGLVGLKGRYEPPLQHFLAAPFSGIWPGSALAVRFPFTFAGLLSVCLIFWWLRTERATLLVYLLTGMAYLGNVAFYLYCRQCRYYGVAILLSTAIAFFYLSSLRKRWTIPLMSVCCTLLLVTHYLDYAALCAVLAADWLIWGRKRFPLSLRDCLWFFVPQIVVGAITLSIWNPLGKTVMMTGSGGVVDRLILFWWAWRDIDRCEFGCLALVAAAPLVWLYRKEAALLRGPFALLIYIATVESLSPQKGWIHLDGKWLQITFMADVRYLATTIPLLIAVTVLVLARAVPTQRAWLALVIGAVAFGTNALEGGRALKTDPLDRPQPLVRSTLAYYIAELIDPPSDPYTQAASWINANVPNGDSVLVFPDYMIYPLMFHAPGVLYAWQIPYPPAKQFEALPPIHFRGQILPDYMICFGPIGLQDSKSTKFPAGSHADLIATIDFLWKDLYRPELPWRTFRPIKDFDRKTDGIYIFKLSIADNLGFHL